MKIPSINNVNYLNYKNNTIQSNSNNKREYAADSPCTFEGRAYNDIFAHLLKSDPLNNFKNFTKKEYLKLNKKQLEALRIEFNNTITNPELKYIGEVHDIVGTCLKSVFDKRFGKDNYVVITLGRSLSSIGKSLGYKIGENNVINIPMSNLKRFYTGISAEGYKKFVNHIEKQENIEPLIKFLKAHKLSKHNIKTSNKNYIIMDYCSSGDSLKGAEQLFKSDFVWGKCDNVYTVDFIKLLDNINPKSYQEQLKNYHFLENSKQQNLSSFLANTLFKSQYKQISTVCYCPTMEYISVLTPKDIIEAFSKKSKLLMFDILDYEMSKSIHKNIDISLRNNLLDSYNVENQKLEPWHTTKSQITNDLTNSILELNKMFVVLDDAKNFEKLTPQIRQYKKELVTIYNYLSDLLQSKFYAGKITEYYDINPIIQSHVEKIQKSLIENKLL